MRFNHRLNHRPLLLDLGEKGVYSSYTPSRPVEKAKLFEEISEHGIFYGITV
jgi:hypothetical protein